MRDKSFLDSNVVLYAFGSDSPRSDRANELIWVGGVISVQVLNEFVNVSRRKMGRDWQETIDALAVIRALCRECLPLTLKTHEVALAIAAQHKYQIHDAMMIASALEADCSTLYSEDMQHGQQIEGLTIRNPFL